MNKLMNLIAYLLGTEPNIAGEMPVCTLNAVAPPPLESLHEARLKHTIGMKDRIYKRELTKSFNLKIESVWK